MKICLVANPNSAHTRRSLEGLIQRGHEISLIGEHRPTNPLPVKVRYLDLSQWNNIPRIRFLHWYILMPRLIREIQPDLIHSIGASGAAWLGSAARFHPFVITATGSDLLLLSQRSALHNRLTINALQKADYVLCLGEHLKQIALRLNVHPERIETTIFGVDTNIFYPATDRKDPPKNTDNPSGLSILSLRAMNLIYNPLVIAQAIPLVLESAPAARFMIMTYNSNAQIFEQFKEIVHSNQVEYAVQYIPPLDGDRAIADCLRKSDITISVPVSDGTPVSVLESMACANALIISDIPSLHQWIVHEHSGLFVPAGDVAELSQAILRLIRDADLRNRIGQNAAKFARENVSKKKQFDTIERVYQKLYD